MLKVEESRFQALFPAHSQAHGIFEIIGVDAQTGKKKGNARTIHRGATLQEWKEHLAGGPKGLGAIPLLDDGVSVKWSAIDIDGTQVDHCRLEAKVNDLKLPLVVCRSKSSGAHCYLFLEEPCAAKEVVDAQTNWAAALGYPGVEIFPKQTRRDVEPNTGNPRPGNWLNLPYFGGEERVTQSATRSSAGPSYGLPGQPENTASHHPRWTTFTPSRWSNFTPPLTAKGGRIGQKRRGHYLDIFGGAILFTALGIMLSGTVLPEAVRNTIYGIVVLGAIIALRERRAA